MESKFAVGVTTPIAPFEQPAPAQLPIALPPRVSAASLLELGISLERSMHRATENHGELTPNSGLTLFRRFAVPWLATALGVGAAAATVVYGGPNSGPLFLIAGLAAGAASGIGLQTATEALATKRRMSVVDDQAAAPLVAAFGNGDAGQKALVTGLATTWASRMSDHTIGGVYVRRQLEGLRAQDAGATGAERGRTKPLLGILGELHDDRGAAKKEFDAGSLQSIASHVKALPEDERPAVASLLIGRLYVKEKPRFRCSDHNAVQQLLYVLVSQLPLDSQVTKRAD